MYLLEHDAKALLPGGLGLMSKSGTLSYESGYRLEAAGVTVFDTLNAMVEGIASRL